VAAPIALLTTTGSPMNGARKTLKGPVFTETCDRVGITLARFMNEMVRANPDLAELESVFASIQTAGKAISRIVQRAPLDGTLGKQGAINVQGEEQKKLDVITNDLLKRVLKYTGRMGVLASEEETAPVPVDNKAHASYELLDDDDRGRYVTVFDPLDGSSNVDAGIPVGTIFGIFEQDEGCLLPENLFLKDTGAAVDAECLRRTLRAGRSLVAAGYVLYSTSTHFILTLGAGVYGFVLDQSLGEFILTNPQIQIPPRGNIFSINGANRRTWDKPMQVFIDSLADGTNGAGTEYTSRYIGSMVGDVHRTLMYGGVFAYPGDSKSPNGKLRLLYEAAPMSFLVEQAGGRSSTGIVPIMDIPPHSVHQRVPCVMGGADEVLECEMLYAKLGDKKLKAAHAALLRTAE
jgi:fructose-1,6-bisphosphatase I